MRRVTTGEQVGKINQKSGNKKGGVKTLYDIGAHKQTKQSHVLAQNMRQTHSQ